MRGEISTTTYLFYSPWNITTLQTKRKQKGFCCWHSSFEEKYIVGSELLREPDVPMKLLSDLHRSVLRNLYLNTKNLKCSVVSWHFAFTFWEFLSSTFSWVCNSAHVTKNATFISTLSLVRISMHVREQGYILTGFIQLNRSHTTKMTWQIAWADTEKQNMMRENECIGLLWHIYLRATDAFRLILICSNDRKKYFLWVSRSRLMWLTTMKW